MSKDAIQRLYNDLGIGDEAARRRYAELARMDREGAQEFPPSPRDWPQWDRAFAPFRDEEDGMAPPPPRPRRRLLWDTTCGPADNEEY